MKKATKRRRAVVRAAAVVLDSLVIIYVAIICGVIALPIAIWLTP